MLDKLDLTNAGIREWANDFLGRYPPPLPRLSGTRLGWLPGLLPGLLLGTAPECVEVDEC